MNIAIICILSLGLLLFGLGVRVSMVRSKTQTFFGCPTDPRDSLCKAVTAHGSTAEWVPFIALIIFALSTRPQPVWVLSLMVATTIARFLVVVGMLFSPSLQTEKPQPLRVVGAFGTYIGGIGLSLALLFA